MNNSKPISFKQISGAEVLKRPIALIGMVLYVVVGSFLIAKEGILIAGALIVIPFGLIFINRLFNAPYWGLWTVIVTNYFIMGINRYIPGSLGLSIDGLLFTTYLALFFQNFYGKTEWHLAANSLTACAAIWFLYVFLELVNPEARSREAWFYAMRGVALYQMLIVPLIFILFNSYKHLKLFLLLWGIFSLLATLKGLQQLYLGVDPFEQKWLVEGGAKTHLLFGKLRVFSFMTDAGQFGASQGQAGVVFSILGLYEKNKRLRFFYLTVAFFGLYCMLISGTRGAIAVPITGFALYFFLSKNIKVMIIGALLGIAVFVFFNYTNIGQDNDQIRRMRTAFDPNDASLQARLENQAKLKLYLATRPIGGGLGSAGNWGKRFSPNTFLADTPTDSWYVMIWAEQGIVGLSLHLGILFFVLIRSSYLIMFQIKNKELIVKISALCSGFFGIMVASYGNGVLGQMPTGIIVYTSLAFIFMSPRLEKELEKESQESLTIA